MRSRTVFNSKADAKVCLFGACTKLFGVFFIEKCNVFVFYDTKQCILSVNILSLHTGFGTRKMPPCYIYNVRKTGQSMNTEFFIRLFVAALLGGIIGLERNYRAKEAGFRTHFLVALGSALFMVVSQNGFGRELEELANLRWDASRIASQVVTGIGFIGAGTIIFQKHVVRGLTTAAGLWVTSAIGLACGSGMYVEATVSTVLVLLCLEALSFILDRFGTKNISLTFTSKSRSKMTETLKTLHHSGMDISNYSLKEQDTPGGKSIVVSMEIRLRRKDYERRVLELMNDMDDVNIESIE